MFHGADAIRYHHVLPSATRKPFPGSYGLFHVRDDEAPGDGHEERWVCWTMLGGRTEASTEDRLTPHLGRVEDGPLLRHTQQRPVQ